MPTVIAIFIVLVVGSLALAVGIFGLLILWGSLVELWKWMRK